LLGLKRTQVMRPLPLAALWLAQLLPLTCDATGTLEASLAAGGLQQPAALASTLRSLGLPTARDVRLLNMPEQLELTESLREEGVNLGSRSKLRRLSEEPPEPGGEPAPEETLREKAGPEHRRTPGSARTGHRRLQSGGGGFSIEVAAIVFTGLIGMVGYAVQARSAEGFASCSEPGAGGGGTGEGGGEGGEAARAGAAADVGVGATAQRE
jgi:hypothetical protein